MRRQENQPARPTAGCMSLPLFNQRKRNRFPLTSAPSENDFFSHSEYTASSSAAPHCASGTYGCYEASGPTTGAPPSHQWNRQGIPSSTPPLQYGSSRPAPGPALPMRTYTSFAHPYKAGGTSSEVGKPINSMRQQDFSPSGHSGQSRYQASQISEGAQIKQVPYPSFSQMGQQSSYRPYNPTHQYSPQPRPLSTPVPPPSRPSACAVEPQRNSWKFTNSFGPQRSTFEAGNRSTNQPQTVRQSQTQNKFPLKPAIENSLRIMTSVIDGMRHWSQFKDKVPYLFEIFATLDSAVTLGLHGAKNFLMRDGKEVVLCVFYENEQELPRLIRGQVHRCVGNYDRSRDVLMCVSVRPGLPSELRNAQEAVKACDAEMRALVKSLSEV